MRIWAIADLHLSFHRPKPMDVFGAHWTDHGQRIAAAWRERVAPEDVVCLPGDFSWAMRLDEVGEELAWLEQLPGRKVLVKGNHDYWWSSLRKLRACLPEGAHALQNDSLVLDGVGFAGARGWVDPALDFSTLLPPADRPAEEAAGLHGIEGPERDRHIYRRELDRLKASLGSLPAGVTPRVALLHFPPTSPVLEETPVTRLLEEHGVDVAVFGHLHGPPNLAFGNPYGRRAGVTYYLVSADFAGFAPVLVSG